MAPARTRRRLPVQRALRLWLAGSAVGAAVVALPDTGSRVVSLSEAHGPSALDLVGVVVLVAAWLPVPALLWSGRASLGGRAGRAAVALAVVGAAALVVTVGLDLGWWWLRPSSPSSPPSCWPCAPSPPPPSLAVAAAGRRRGRRSGVGRPARGRLPVAALLHDVGRVARHGGRGTRRGR